MALTLVERATRQVDEAVGVLTLSEVRDHVLLWAHYADSHRGICLEFDSAKAGFPRLSSVRYTNDCPRFEEVIEAIGVHHLNQQRPGLLANVAYQAATHNLPRDAIWFWTGHWLYSKSADWEYEKEWRAVLPSPGLSSFPENALTGVIIGCDAQDDELAILRETLQRRRCPTPFYRAVRKQGFYGLEIVPVDIESLPRDATARKRKRLAVELFSALNAAKAENDLDRRDFLLKELRALARKYSDDAAVREQLAMGLCNILNDAIVEGDLARSKAFLDALRALAAAHPDDIALRDVKDQGLHNMLICNPNVKELPNWYAMKLLHEYQGRRGWGAWLQRFLIWLSFLLRRV
jgi:hypothetical protein